MRRLNWLIALLTIILVGFVLRVFRLDAQSLWYDEAFSAYLAHFDLAQIAARTAADIQPPLYYYLLHFWTALVGDSEFALRFLSLVFGVSTIPLLYVVARRLYSLSPALRGRGGVGVVVAILATVSPLYVWYSQEARMYTLITFLLLLSSYALLRAIEDTQGNRWWGVLVVANIAAIYTHYFAFVVIAFQLLFTFYVLRLTRRLIRFTLYFALIFAAFLPWIPFVVARFGQDVSYWRGALKLDEAIRHIFINFTTGESVLESQAQWIAMGWLVCLLASLFASWLVHRRTNQQTNQPSNHPTVFLVLYLIIPLALLLLLFSRNPKFNARYLMIASPAFLLLLAVGFARAKQITHYYFRFTIYLLAFSFLLLTSLYSNWNIFFDPAFTKASFRDVARFIEQHAAPDEAIILSSGHLFPAFNYYYRETAPQIRLPDEPTLNAEHVLGYDTARVLNQTLANRRGVWVVLWQDEVVDPNGFVPMLLSAQGKEQPLEPTNFYQVRLRHWTLDSNANFPVEPTPQIKRTTNFKNQIELLGLDVLNPTPADVGASFNLYWRALDQIDEDYIVSLRVVDAVGNLWGKQDRRPAGYNYPTTRWNKDEKLFGAYTVPLIAGTPAGNYFVDVTVYTASNPIGLDILAPNGAPLGKSVRVGPIKVLPPTQTIAQTSLVIPNTLNQRVGPFTLLGYQLGRNQASAGESIPLTLFWRADAKPDKDYTMRIAFGDAPSDAFPISNPQSQTSTWRAGEIVRGQYAVAIPATAKDGATKLRVVLSDGSAIDLASLTIEKTDRVFVKPTMQFEQNANFTNAIALVGYQLPTSVSSGDSLKIVLYWQARAKMDKSYTVFVHLLDQNNKVAAQKDTRPVNGTRPTTGWVANEYIADPYELAIKPDIAPGTYRIEIGVYDSQDPSFARLMVLDDSGAAVGDHVILNTTIQVR